MKNRHFRALVWFSLEEKLVLKKSTDIFETAAGFLLGSTRY